MTEIEHDRPDLFDPLDRIDQALPVLGALARLVTRSSPRWAYSAWAADVVGPLRRERVFSDVALKRGFAAQPARVKQVRRNVRGAGGVFGYVWVNGDVIPAQPAQPPLAPLLEGVGELGTLAVLVEHLDALSGQPVRERPDSRDGMAVERWSQMATAAHGRPSPPLRWPALPPEAGRRGLPDVLAGVPRFGPVTSRDGEETDPRVLALRVLVEHAHARGADIDPADVLELARWVHGSDRARLTRAARGGLAGHFATELGTAGVHYAEQSAVQLDPQALADELTAQREEMVTVG